MSLFLKREGSTKSHPLARKASSPLRSGSPRSDVSLIIMAGAETRRPLTGRGQRRGPPARLPFSHQTSGLTVHSNAPKKSHVEASVVLTVADSSHPGSACVLPKQQPSTVAAQRDAPRRSSDTGKAARQTHGTGACGFDPGLPRPGRKTCGVPPSDLDVCIRCGLTGACCQFSSDKLHWET